MAIQIITLNESLVVDSRLIADELGIEHATLLKTIKKHLDRLERKEPVRFEIDVVKRPQGGTYEVSYCYLNEYQATLLMTFSRNTEQVLDCKEKLVDGFSKAKQIINEVIPAQNDRIRELQMQNENLRLELQLTTAKKQLEEFRYTITQTCPEPIQQKVLGYQEVKVVEYRDRHYLSDRLVNDGSTLTKAEICYRYSILTKNGKPDYKRLNALLEHHGIADNSDAWQLTATIQENHQLKREFLPVLDKVFTSGLRQLWLGE